MVERRDVIKSKESIKESFLCICAFKDIRKITVKEIIDGANVSRGTFYAHFNDVYDLKDKIETEIIEQLFCQAQSKDITDVINEPYSVIFVILFSFYNNREKIKKLIGTNRDYRFFFKCEQKLLNILSTSQNYYSEDIMRNVIDNCIMAMIVRNCYNIVTQNLDENDVKKYAEIMSSVIYKAVH